jgi:hypothetical protein
MPGHVLAAWSRRPAEDRLRADIARLRDLLRRFVKYATEDRAVTPGSTRLARLLTEVKVTLAATEREPNV